MRVLIVVENYPPHYGGVEIVFKNTAEGLAARGHDVTLVTHLVKGSVKHETVNGVKIHRVPCTGSRYLFTFLAPLYAWRYAKHADIIHTTTFNAAPAAWLVARLRRKPVVITVHETWIGKWREYTNMNIINSTVHALLEHAVFVPRYDRYICVSESTAKNMRRARKSIAGRVVVNHNGFDYSHWERKKHAAEAKRLRNELGLGKNKVVLAYGRPGYSKGFEFLIKAIPKICAARKDARFVLILSKDKQYLGEYNKILSLIADEGIGDVVKVLLPQGYAKLPPYLAAADCIVVPSLSEGFGYTTVEANAIGTPVVASDTTSIPEVISGKYVLVPPKDPEAIAKGVIQALAGKCKKTPLKRFLWSENIDNLETIYYSLLPSQPRERSTARR